MHGGRLLGEALRGRAQLWHLFVIVCKSLEFGCCHVCYWLWLWELWHYTRKALPGSGSGSDSDSGGGHATALQEFSDIVGWIPELAADSELMKADFESAVATGNKLTAAFAETLGPQSTKPFDAATIEPLIEELRKLVPQSQDRKDRM